MRKDTLSDLLGFPLGPVACGIKRRTGGSARLELNHGVVADLLGCSATALCEKPDSLKLLQLFLGSTAIGSEPPQIIAGGSSELPSIPPLTIYAAHRLRSFNDFQLRRNHFHFIKIVRLEVFKGLDQFRALFRQIKTLGWVVQ